jgi:nucleobase:cation symporter-1, NCS1 family
VHQAGGSKEIFQLKATIYGSTKAGRWLQAMSSVTGKLERALGGKLINEVRLIFIIGSWATLACNIPDFSRYARSSKGQSNYHFFQ